MTDELQRNSFVSITACEQATNQTVELQPSADLAVKDRNLSDDEHALILAQHAQGRSIAEIARHLNRRWHTIADYLSKHEDVAADVARKYLNTKRIRAVEAWEMSLEPAAKKGDHRPAKDLLLHTEVIEEKDGSSAQVAVQVVIGMPGQPAGPDPLGNHNGPYQTQREDVGLTSQQLTATLRPASDSESEGRK